MQNWEAMQPTVNYDQHNSWYNSMFAANIKVEPRASSASTSPIPLDSPPPSASIAATTTTQTCVSASQLENYLKQQHHNHQQQPMDTMCSMTPSPSNTHDSMQHFFDSNMQQQLLQQQQYQQQFQQAQQAAAQNQINAATHLPLGFNPLTPPGLPTAVLPPISHFYNHANLRVSGQQTPSPQPVTGSTATQLAVTPMDNILSSNNSEKLQSALTPRNTPPMDVTPPKSPKTLPTMPTKSEISVMENEPDLISNSSEDMKYMAESEEDESIRLPIYNSHGKMKNYKCKTCGLVAITKIAFWEHTRSHMKPEKILQCPKCPFVTELKHHLEYHIRKHKNLKPFQCDKCSYSCVNKSMLNSHRKSHSSVYQYRCMDCDYATKYCHSFKLHLRKYEHNPGVVLDEEGMPNPSVVIDVYGTRRGPKSKSGGSTGTGGGGGSNKRSNGNGGGRSGSSDRGGNDAKKQQPTSQLSAALQGFTLPHQQQQQQQPNLTQQQQHHNLPTSPAKSASSATSDLSMTLGMNFQQQQHHHHHQKQQQHKNSMQQQQHKPIQLQQQQQQQQQQLKLHATSPHRQQQQQQQPPHPPSQQTMSSLLPPLASLLQQNRNMASFFPYWNINLQMLAAQQQAAVLAQLSPRMRETALQQIQQQQLSEKSAYDSAHEEDANEHDNEVDNEDDDETFERKSVDSAMDLSQGTPTKAERTTTPELAINLKLPEESNETPLISSSSSSRRKGRVLKLDALLQTKSASQSPEQPQKDVASPLISVVAPLAKAEDDEENNKSVATASTGATADSAPTVSSPTAAPANTSSSSTASSSGNSSNSSSSNSSIPADAIYECKYCDIYFKDAVLYTIHMGYHSCDDVFKCNMCGEKCDGPVGLFVHMARNAHS